MEAGCYRIDCLRLDFSSGAHFQPAAEWAGWDCSDRLELVARECVAWRLVKQCDTADCVPGRVVAHPGSCRFRCQPNSRPCTASVEELGPPYEAGRFVGLPNTVVVDDWLRNSFASDRCAGVVVVATSGLQVIELYYRKWVPQAGALHRG